MSVQVRRDSFARHDVVRRTVESSGTCKWCGGKRQRKGTPVNRLFEYGINRDDRNRDEWEGKLFCSKSCHDSYSS